MQTVQLMISIKRTYYILFIFSFVLAVQMLSQNSTQDSMLFHVQKVDSTLSKGPSPIIEKYGMGLSMYVPGTFKLNTSSGPLIVIDGIPYPNRLTDELDYTTADLYDISKLAMLPLQSIQHVEYLPYSEDYSFLGSSNYNGIISITTKKGSSNKISIDYSFRNTHKHQQKGYELLNGGEYTVMMNQAFYNTTYNQQINYDQLNYDPSFEDFHNYNKNTDWQDEIRQTGISNEHYLALRGAGKDINYGLITSYAKETGTIKYTGAEDYSIQFNFLFSPSKIINTRINLNYKNTSSKDYFKGGSNMNIYELSMRKMPNMSVYRHNTDGTATTEYFAPQENFQKNTYYNPVQHIDLSEEKQKRQIINPTLNLTLSPLKSLSFLLDVSYQKQELEKDTYDPYLSNTSHYPQETSTSTYESNINDFHLSNRIVYNLKIASTSTLDFTGSYVFNKKNYVYDGDIQGSSYSGAFLLHMDSEIKSQILGLSTKYSLLDRYFVRANLSRENYMNTDFSNSYSFGGNWIISNEPFLGQLKFLHHLSAKASYNHLEIPVSEDGDIETTNTLEFNVSANLFNRVTFNFSTYSRNYTDVLIDAYYYHTYQSSDSYLINYNPVKQNFEDDGWELNTKIKVLDQPTFKMDVFASIYHVNHQISDVTDDQFWANQFYNDNGFDQKTEYSGNIYAYQFNGVYAYDEYIAGKQESAPIARDANGSIIKHIDGTPVMMSTYGYEYQGGDAIYEDVNHDGTIDENDKVNIGNVNPKITGTCGTSFQYKNWWMGVFFNFRYGNDIINLARQSLTNMYTTSNQSSETLNRWRKQGDQTDVPRALYQYGYNSLGSSRFIEDGSFFRLKAITLKHDFSENITSKLHLTNLTVYVTAKNLLTLTNYKGADPDISLNTSPINYGYDEEYQGLTEEFTFGINIGL